MPPTFPPVPPSALEGYTKNRDLLWEDLHQQVSRALLLLDEDLVQEYRQAAAAVPHLLAREAPVDVFLKAENYHPLLAAKRMAAYWRVRRKLFGPKRWLLPLMARAAGGALPPQQIQILQSGVHVVLTQTEPTPQAVLVSDLSRLPQGAEHFHPQLIFYLLSTASVACSALQTTGLTILHVIQDGYRPLILPEAQRLKQISESLPMRIAQIVVAQSCLTPIGKEHLLAYRLFEQHRICEANNKVVSEAHRAPLDCLTAPTPAAMLLLLQAKNLSPAVLPVSLGGNFHYERDLGPWLAARAALEQVVWQQDIAAAAASRQPVAAVSLSSSISPTSSAAIPSATSASSEHLLVRQAPGESMEEFGRRRNAVYAKRFTQKQKWARLELQAKHEMLQSTQKALRAENERLTDLWPQAQALVAVHTGGNVAMVLPHGMTR